jgi:hypothetical protein
MRFGSESTGVRCEQRLYIVGNAHTHPGWMHVYAPSIDRGYIVSLSEIAEMSNLARVWIAGFLAGNEPSLNDYLGCDDAGDLADDDPDVLRWIEACRRFRSTGDLPPLYIVDPTGLCRRTPGCRLCPFGIRQASKCGPGTANGEEWSLADPQPDLVWNSFLAGTFCDQRGWHADAEPIPPAHAVCADCGFVTEEA